jgi:hypothetical protein
MACALLAAVNFNYTPVQANCKLMQDHDHAANWVVA